MFFVHFSFIVEEAVTLSLLHHRITQYQKEVRNSIRFLAVHVHGANALSHLGPVVQKTISLIQDSWKFCGQNYRDVDKDV